MQMSTSQRVYRVVGSAVDEMRARTKMFAARRSERDSACSGAADTYITSNVSRDACAVAYGLTRP